MNRLASEVLDSYDDSQDYIARYSFDLSSNRMTKSTHNAATSTAISAFLSSGTFSGDKMISYEYDANDRLLTEAKDAAGTNEGGKRGRKTEVVLLGSGGVIVGVAWLRYVSRHAQARTSGPWRVDLSRDESRGGAASNARHRGGFRGF